MVRNISASVQRQDPEHKQEYERNTQEYLAQLDGLEADIYSKEQALAALGDEINAASERSDVEAVRSLGARFGAAEAEVERLLEQWTRV